MRVPVQCILRPAPAITFTRPTDDKGHAVGSSSASWLLAGSERGAIALRLGPAATYEQPGSRAGGATREAPSNNLRTSPDQFVMIWQERRPSYALLRRTSDDILSGDVRKPPLDDASSNCGSNCQDRARRREEARRRAVRRSWSNYGMHFEVLAALLCRSRASAGASRRTCMVRARPS